MELIRRRVLKIRLGPTNFLLLISHTHEPASIQECPWSGSWKRKVITSRGYAQKPKHKIFRRGFGLKHDKEHKGQSSKKLRAIQLKVISLTMVLEEQLKTKNSKRIRESHLKRLKIRPYHMQLRFNANLKPFQNAAILIRPGLRRVSVGHFRLGRQVTEQLHDLDAIKHPLIRLWASQLTLKLPPLQKSR